MATAPEKRLWEQGSVVWAKIAGRPWWPCVVFSSWEVRSRRPRRGARRPCAANMHGEPPAQVLEEWDLPIDLEDAVVQQHGMAIFCMRKR